MNRDSISGNDENFRSGFVAIIGRPNVGKSTLLNRLLGQKISITSRKPQTTRWQLLGIDSGDDFQIAYIDTPGIQTRYTNLLNRHMTREATDTLSHVELVMLVVEALKWTEADEYIASMLDELRPPLLLVINKVDKIKNRKSLLPFIKKMHERFKVGNIVPVSAKAGDNLTDLHKQVVEFLPIHPPIFSPDQVTDRSERFLAAEFIREKLTRKLGDELPYKISVTVDEFRENEKFIRINATIWVENERQKSIVIGKNGNILKSVGEQSRHDMEKLFQRQIYLDTWVKVKRKWSESESSLKQFGYTKCNGTP